MTERNIMAYYFTKKLEIGFDEAIERTVTELKKRGFGVLTDIDVTATLKEKLDVDFRRYRILGTCNPPFAYKVLQAEDKIGLMLPCNVIVQEHDDNSAEVSAIDPATAMQGVGNSSLEETAMEVRGLLREVIESL
jgi:uncharacterized protein (DUF302 family)